MANNLSSPKNLPALRLADFSPNLRYVSSKSIGGHSESSRTTISAGQFSKVSALILLRCGNSI